MHRNRTLNKVKGIDEKKRSQDFEENLDSLRGRLIIAFLLPGFDFIYRVFAVFKLNAYSL